jgi:hypothetical protein
MLSPTLLPYSLLSGSSTSGSSLPTSCGTGSVNEHQTWWNVDGITWYNIDSVMEQENWRNIDPVNEHERAGRPLVLAKELVVMVNGTIGC